MLSRSQWSMHFYCKVKCKIPGSYSSYFSLNLSYCKICLYRSRSALEYWFSNTFTAFCFLSLFVILMAMVYISRGFKGPHETILSKPTFLRDLFTRVWREIRAPVSDLGKPQGESKLVFMITLQCLRGLENTVAAKYFPAGFLSNWFVLPSCGCEFHSWQF